MKADLTGPCTNCPFRSDKRFFLTRGRAGEIWESMAVNEGSFPCHKTVDYSNDDGGRVKPDSQFCGGAMVLLAKERQLLRPLVLRWLFAVHEFDPEQLNMNAPVFDSADEFTNAVEE